MVATVVPFYTCWHDRNNRTFGQYGWGYGSLPGRLIQGEAATCKSLSYPNAASIALAAWRSAVSIVASLEMSVPMVHDYEVYDFKLEARVGFFF